MRRERGKYRFTLGCASAVNAVRASLIAMLLATILIGPLFPSKAASTQADDYCATVLVGKAMDGLKANGKTRSKPFYDANPGLLEDRTKESGLDVQNGTAPDISSNARSFPALRLIPIGPQGTANRPEAKLPIYLGLGVGTGREYHALLGEGARVQMIGVEQSPQQVQRSKGTIAALKKKFLGAGPMSVVEGDFTTYYLPNGHRAKVIAFWYSSIIELATVDAIMDTIYHQRDYNLAEDGYILIDLPAWDLDGEFVPETDIEKNIHAQLRRITEFRKATVIPADVDIISEERKLIQLVELNYDQITPFESVLQVKPKYKEGETGPDVELIIHYINPSFLAEKIKSKETGLDIAARQYYFTRTGQFRVTLHIAKISYLSRIKALSGQGLTTEQQEELDKVTMSGGPGAAIELR